jgi:hypothetical protein
MSKLKTFKSEFLDHSYETKLLHEYIGRVIKNGDEIIHDCNFGLKYIHLLKPEYFSTSFGQNIVTIIHEHHAKYKTIPDYTTIKGIINRNIKDNVQRKQTIAYLNEIYHSDPKKNRKYIQDSALDFLKQQRLYKAIIEIQSIYEAGDFKEYNSMKEIISQALHQVSTESLATPLDIDTLAALQFAKSVKIPTGFEGLDLSLNGGHPMGKIALFVGGLKFGKTTLFTRLAYNAYKLGFNVLQIFFEDTEEDIQLKQIACITGMNTRAIEDDRNYKMVRDNLLIKHKPQLKELKSNWRIKRLPPVDTTADDVFAFIDMEINSGFKPDLVLIDYLEVIEGDRKYSDEWKKEGRIMRQFEYYCATHNIAGWIATQGARSSLNTNVLRIADAMGGSIDKGKIAHLILTGAKTTEHRNNHTANLFLEYCRYANDSILFMDVPFHNGTLQIQIPPDSVYEGDIDELGN